MKARSHGAARRRLVVAASLALAVVVAATGLATSLYVFPDTDRPAKADGIVVLGGLYGNEVVAEALALVDAGVSQNVLISDSFGKNTAAERVCDNPAYPHVICFKADPNTTAGESAEIGRFASEHDWNHIVVVTMDYHVSRARFIVWQCNPGRQFDFVGASTELGPGDWLYQYTYQSAAFVKAVFAPAC